MRISDLSSDVCSSDLLLVVGAGELLPHLLLAVMVIGDGEGHELLKRHVILGVEVEELRRNRSELQALLHDTGAAEDARGALLLAHAGVAKGLEGSCAERRRGTA